MGHKIQTTFIKGTSNWIEDVPNPPYTREMLDHTDPEQLAKDLISEFRLTDAESRRKFLPIITEWLEEMTTETLDDDVNSKVRDYIYEMF